MGNRASLIFSRFLWENKDWHTCGSARMQREVFASMQELGLNPIFAGSEDREYPAEVIDSDIIVSLAYPLRRLPVDLRAKLLLYTCNTHVKTRIERLRRSSEKWGLPVDEGINVDCFEHAYSFADYLFIAENNEGISNFLKEGIRTKKIIRYSNCTDLSLWYPSKEKQGQFTFVNYVSSGGLRKGLPALFLAWKQWYKGQNAKLVIVGQESPVSRAILGSGTGEKIPGLYSLLSKNAIEQSELRNFIASCHVGIFPTLEDAQPSALLETAACGIPIATTRESGIDFPVEFCKYFHADDPTVIANVFEFYYQRQNDIRAYGAATHDFVAKNHSWPVFRKRIAEVLQFLLTRQ